MVVECKVSLALIFLIIIKIIGYKGVIIYGKLIINFKNIVVI